MFCRRPPALASYRSLQPLLPPTTGADLLSRDIFLPPVSAQKQLSPSFAAHTKNTPVSPLVAALTKTKDFKPFVCRTYEKNQGGVV
jgi:hypothetical protein